MSIAIGKSTKQQTENKQERATRIADSRLCAKLWYTSRVVRQERKRLAENYVIATQVEQELTEQELPTVTLGVEQELTEQELTTVTSGVGQELTTVTSLEHGSHSTRKKYSKE